MRRRKRKASSPSRKKPSSTQNSGIAADVEASHKEAGNPPLHVESTLEALSPDKNHRKPTRAIFRRNLYRLAKLWIKLLTAVTSTIFLTTVLTIVGLGSWAPPPLLDFIRLYPILSITIISILTLISFFAWFFSRGSILTGEKGDKEDVAKANRQHDRNVLYATFISTIPCVVCFVLLSVILLRPSWCPTLLCPAPKLILNQNGVHDNNLEVYFQTVQSSSYFIPDDPAHYALDTLPKETSALHIDTSPQKPYRVVLGIHSLQQGSIGLIIEQITLIVKQVTLVPYPLNLWMKGETQDYHSNLYQVLYGGQETGARLLATYTPLNGALDSLVQLLPGESDELDIQVMSRVVADLHFQIQVRYRVINEEREQTITLPNLFEIIFSNASNWHPYHFLDGRLVAGS